MNFKIAGRRYSNRLVLHVSLSLIKSRRLKVFLEKGVLNICSKFTWEHPCRSVISIKLHGCSSVNLLHIFRKLFPKNTPGWLLLFSHSQRKSSVSYDYGLTHFRPLISFDTPWKKPLVFWCFQGISKEISGMIMV